MTMPHRLPRHPLVPVVLGAVDMALGIVLVLEPDARISAPSFAVARQWMPMNWWGLILLLLSCLIVGRTAFDRHAGYALSLSAAWHAFFVVAMSGAAIHDRRAALTGICVYSGVVVLHLLAAWRKVR